MSLSATEKHFQQWLNRPFVVARKRSVVVANSLGICHSKIHGLWSLPGCRDGYAQAARNMIASGIKIERLRARLGCLKMAHYDATEGISAQMDAR